MTRFTVSDITKWLDRYHIQYERVSPEEEQPPTYRVTNWRWDLALPHLMLDSLLNSNYEAVLVADVCLSEPLAKPEPYWLLRPRNKS